MVPIPGVPGKHVMQIAFMVEDLHAACMNWVRTTGIGPFLEVPHVVLEEFGYRGTKSSGLDFSVAIAQSGGVQIELVQQHSDGPSAYRDTIARGEGGFHHLAIYTDDYDATYGGYVGRGFVAAVDGTFGGYRFSYIDTSPAIGCMVELIEANPLQTDFFERIAAAAEGWDGETDPIRTAFPAA
ncbi:methylmalonyl-CoA epimerase [Novosphingobium sp. PC22D]|uniref:VOC family protein n=1 Tax=Novosphingobium sp. PC22D TaxID=1962403 RepID=UPI000BFB03B7|nr:VOC family protein [Novosphingobium sp. PC22D]PEQ14313.1 methylmalonyl-CoA epimerase [Novosphingobium sp. PC22D]